MERDKTIEWQITQGHIGDLGNLGYKVELSEDPLYQRTCFVHNSFNNLDGFTYEVAGNNYLPFPQEGIPNPVVGRNVRLPYEPEKLMKFIAVSKNNIIQRISPDGERILESIDTKSISTRYIAVNESNNDIWITTPEDFAIVISVPFLESHIKYIPVSLDSLAIIPDGFRKVFWEITSQNLRLKSFNGKLAKEWNLSLEANKVLSCQILQSTGDVYFCIETNDPTASSTRFLVFCEFAGDIFIVDSVNLDKKIGCISKWDYNSVLTGGKGTEITKWISNIPTMLADLSGDGVKSIFGITAKPNDTIYISDHHNRIMSFDSVTFAKQWQRNLTGAGTRNIQAMFNCQKDGRPILFSNNRASGKTTDLVSAAGTIKAISTEGTGESFVCFGMANKAAVAYVRISGTEEIIPSSSSSPSFSSSSSSSSSSLSSLSSNSSSSFSSLSSSSSFSSLSSTSSISSESCSTASTMWNYTIIDSSNVRINSYLGTDLVVAIPNTINNIPVTSLAAKAFENKPQTSITLPNSLISIGNEAFRGSSIKNMTIPDNVTLVGSSLFYGCVGLENITIGNGITSISPSLFYGCINLTSVILGTNVSNIQNSSFQNCSKLSSINLDNSITTIGTSVFQNCSSLSSLVIPGSISIISNNAFNGCSGLINLTLSEGNTTIQSGAFTGCVGLTTVDLPASLTSLSFDPFGDCSNLTEINTNIDSQSFSDIDGVLYNKDFSTIFKYPEGKSGTSYTIPDGVVTIFANAFRNLSSFTSIVIPNGVTSIADYAFYGCSGLTTIDIPEGVLTIPTYVFRGCSSLTTINLPNSLVSFSTGAFYGCTSLTSIDIPITQTAIQSYTFYNCSSLTSINIPSGVTSINFQSFYNCIGITSIELPGNLITIGELAFENCRFAELIIPETVITIGAFAFRNSRIEFVYIPDSVTSLNLPFHNCAYLEGIAVGESNTNYKSVNGVLFSKNGETLLQFPGKRGGAYTIPDGVKYIGDNAFYNCNYVTSITTPSSVLTIGTNAFQDANSLSSLILSSGLTTISANAFRACNALTTVTIPDTVSSIEEYAFLECPSLTAINVDLANATYSSDDGVLYDKITFTLQQCPIDKTGIYSVVGTTKIIGKFSFQSSKLTEIILPVGLTRLNERAFNASLVETINIPSGVTTIELNCFNASSITGISIPSSVTAIGDQAFVNCQNLTDIDVDPGNSYYIDVDGVLFNHSITLLLQFPSGKAGAYIIPDTVSRIGSYAFYNADVVTSIVFPYSIAYLESSEESELNVFGITSIGNYSFQGCSSLISVTIPVRLNSFGSSAFRYCSSLVSVIFNGDAPSLGDAFVFNGLAVGAKAYYYEWAEGFDAAWSTRAGIPIEEI